MSLLDTTRVIIKSLVLSSPEPLTIHQLDRDYEKQEGENIQYERLGFANLKSFLLSMQETLTYDSATRTFTVTKNKGGNSEHIQKLVSGQKTARKKSNNSRSSNHSNYSNNNGQNRDHQISWDRHPLNRNNYNGNHSQLNYIVNYSQPIGNQLSYTANALATSHARTFEPGPGNLLGPPSYIRNDSLLGIMPQPLMTIKFSTCPVTNQTPAMRHDSNGRTKNYNKYKSDAVKKNSGSKTDRLTCSEANSNRKLNGDADASGEKTDSNSEENAPALPPIDDDDPINLIGSKMINSKYGRKIPPAEMPENLQSGCAQQIYVTEVTKFPYFYFQFAGTDDTMRGLQYELDSLYDNNNTTAERIRQSEIQTRNFCAAYYSNKWSRAEILSLYSDRVKLLFVDYGTIDYVPISDTRYLYAEICEIPRLCHRGALAFVEPLRNDQVPLEKLIVQTFCGMVMNRPLMAVFSNVDESDDISITLVDTSDETKDLIVNKILMEKLNGIQ